MENVPSLHIEDFHDVTSYQANFGSNHTCDCRAVNSHALSVSLTSGHYFSRCHAKHLKSDFACHFFLKFKLIYNLMDADTKRTAKYYFFFLCFRSSRQAILKS